MNSKEALCEILKRTDKKESKYTTQCAEIIVRDLEILDILKKQLFVRIEDKPMSDGTYFIGLHNELEYSYTYTGIYVTKEEKEKIKEWLEDDYR